MNEITKEKIMPKEQGMGVGMFANVKTVEQIDQDKQETEKTEKTTEPTNTEE
jgi:hypothetical protein